MRSASGLRGGRGLALDLDFSGGRVAVAVSVVEAAAVVSALGAAGGGGGGGGC